MLLGYKKIALLLLPILVSACSTYEEHRKQRSYTVINEVAATFDVAGLVENYVNSIANYDWENDTSVNLSSCEPDQTCLYTISHYAHGCLFSSKVVSSEAKENSDTRFQVMQYTPSICE